MLDPLRHPDLLDVEERIRRQLTMVLEAEQAAALVRHQRRLDLRDRLIDLEEAGTLAALSTTDGQLWTGRVTAVGADHAVLGRSESDVVVMLYHITAIETMR